MEVYTAFSFHACQAGELLSSAALKKYTARLCVNLRFEAFADAEVDGDGHGDGDDDADDDLNRSN